MRRCLVAAMGGLAGLAACSSPAKPPPLNDCRACDASAAGSVPVCGACTRTSDCAATLSCSAGGYCALQCSGSSPCPLGLPCSEGLCVCTTPGLDSGGDGADAALEGDASATDSGEEEAGGARSPAGLVEVKTATYDSSGATWSSTVASAQFSGAGGPCLPSVVAGCQVYTCFGVLPPGPTAGAITLEGGDAPDGGIVLEVDPDAGGYVVVRDLLANDFPPGSTINVSAAGDAVPSFTTSVKAATDVYLSSVPTTLDRQHDAAITWTQGSAPGGAFGTVVVSIAAQSPNVTVACSGPVSSGSLTLPAAALQALPTGHSSVMELSVQNETLSMTGATPITARHTTIAHTASGDEALPVAVPIFN